MRLQLHAVKFTADQSLLEFVERKLSKLDTFHDQILGVDVFLRLDGSETSKVKEKIVEVRLLLPGKELFVTERDKSFESATDRILDVMKDKLVRCKEKRTGLSSLDIRQARYQLEAEAVDQADE
jgi:putative sigma-54 modulation protein